jgi:exopolyphosphatase / guanosine-5'-triphosphate,3'-diphosphate pyrophosphatase
LNQHWGVDADPTAQGRLKGAEPVAVLDIGSNSVRLVVYERHARALTALYNEKTACALGRGVALTGKLAEENMRRALTAIQRFALVTKLMRVGRVHVLATSAVREAANRSEFVDEVEALMGVPVRVLSGAEEAHFAALGAVAGIPGFSGIVGDLGGGSLELSLIDEGGDSLGESHNLGVIRLQDDSSGSPSKAATIIRQRLKGSLLARAESGTFCAIGGTWRTLAKIHQVERDYPLHMVQDYSVNAADLAKLCDTIVEAAEKNLKAYPGADNASSSRRELVPFGAAVMGEVIRAGRFSRVVFSALGVREGYLYGLLDQKEQAIDPLRQGAEELSVLRSRSPAHSDDLVAFTAELFAALGVEETPEEARLREVACLLSDIGWRGHPDYRGMQSIDLVAYGSLTGVDHPSRAFLSEALAVRYIGLKHRAANPAFLAMAGVQGSARARLIGASFRVAYPMSAAMPGVLPRTHFTLRDGVLELRLPNDLAFLDGEHLQGRLDGLAGVAGCRASTVIVG